VWDEDTWMLLGYMERQPPHTGSEIFSSHKFISISSPKISFVRASVHISSITELFMCPLPSSCTRTPRSFPYFEKCVNLSEICR
jgi:hypothetical protein